MQSVTQAVTAVSGIPIDHIVGLIALAGLGLASFAIYVVFSIVRERSGK